MNAFMAHLTTRKVENLAEFGVWVMKDIMEKGGVYGEMRADKLDFCLPIVAVWILVAGKELYGYDGRVRMGKEELRTKR
jgi:hypothetical protein